MKEGAGPPAIRPGDVAFAYNGIDVRWGEDALINMTAMWRAQGCPRNKEPKNWRRREGASFVKHRVSIEKVSERHLLRADKGRFGSTWGHWQIALAYAKYLSNEFHSFVNEAFRQWVIEEANPDLKADRAIQGYRRQGWSDERISARIDGKLVRHELTDTLKEHGVEGAGYAYCTDAINRQVLGSSAKELKLRRGLPAKAKTRDCLNSDELTAVRFAEMLARRELQSRQAKGNTACEASCDRAGSVVKTALMSISRA